LFYNKDEKTSSYNVLVKTNVFYREDVFLSLISSGILRPIGIPKDPTIGRFISYLDISKIFVVAFILIIFLLNLTKDKLR
jgi:hypothetical protein